MAGNVGETVNIICPVEKSSSTSTRDSAKELALLKEILSAVCALLNSNGGKVVLHNMPSTQRMSVIRKLEQSMISIIGIQLTTSNINFKEDKESIVIYVKKADYLITTNYNLYLPTQTQVVQVSSMEPLEKIKDDIIKRKVVPREVQRSSHCKIFYKDNSFGFPEGKSVQLKHLKSDRSKRTRLADRVTGKGNKFSCYVSAFANRQGGHIYYGITDDGIVEGELISSEEEKHEITKKVEKAINKMIWPELIGQPKRGTQWDIFFEPVVDEESKSIPSTFVIVVYIAPCLGGVFTDVPECYEIVEEEVKKMSFASWRRKLQPTEIIQRKIPCTLQCMTWGSIKIRNICTCADQQLTQRMNNGIPITAMSTKHKEKVLQPVWLRNKEEIPSTVHRIVWSSSATEQSCRMVDEVLMKTINNAQWEFFSIVAKLFEETYPKHLEICLLVLSKRVITCCRRSCFKKANRLLLKYNTMMHREKDSLIFKAISLYLEIALARAQQKLDLAVDIIAEGLSIAELIPPGNISASLLVLAATSSSKGKEQQRNQVSQQVLCEKALEHLQKVDKPSSITTDLERKAHINLAGQHLDCSFPQNLDPKDRKEVNLDKAKSSIVAVEQSIKKEGPLSFYRQIQFDNVQSILHYRCSQVPKDESLSEYQLIEKALESCRKAKRQAKACQFHEMIEWTAASEGLYTEELVRAHFRKRRKKTDADTV